MLDAMPQDKRLDYVDLKLSQKRQVKLRTCADVYAHWGAYKRAYKKAPREGVEFQIDYIDTGLAMSEEERSRAPIALALHGAPGSYHDYSLLIQHLAQQRVRVIAPNFPEYIATVKTKVLFRHSADEKAAYLRDFLRAINVKTIDLLVSHSSAIFPTLLILLNANKEAIARQQQRKGRQRSGARQNRGQRQQQQPQRRNNSFSVESLSEIGDQLKELNLEAGAATVGELNDETFVDASEELDDNNNNAKGQQPNKNMNEPRQVSIEIVDEQQQDEGKREGQGQGQGEKSQEPGRKQQMKKAPLKMRVRRSSSDPIVTFDEPIEIKSVALFNPAGHRMPKSMKPVWFKCGSVHVYQQKLGRSIFRKFGPPFLTVIGEVVRVENMDHVMLSATVMRNSKCHRVVSQLEQLSQMKIPTLLVFSENDKLIEKEIFYEMTQFMRLDPKTFDVFNNEADMELSQCRTDEDWIRVMVFKAGGHYAYSNYAKTVNNAVSDLLSKVTTTQQTTAATTTTTAPTSQ